MRQQVGQDLGDGKSPDVNLQAGLLGVTEAREQPAPQQRLLGLGLSQSGLVFLVESVQEPEEDRGEFVGNKHGASEGSHGEAASLTELLRRTEALLQLRGQISASQGHLSCLK